ncbi:MAG: ATP-binding protein [Desulfobulbaceae bacterium]|nr:ATP-binding protein [Desulfobulbaceae bacterium]
MLITHIELTNIRCIDSLRLPLNCEKKLKRTTNQTPWTMILGDNGVGKSTILRSIALGLCDESNAAALMKELRGGFIKEGTANNRGESEGKIKIKLSSENRNYTITTKISKKSPQAPEKVAQTVDDDFPWEKLITCGYGPNMATTASESYSEYARLESVYTLFNYTGSLQNPELMYRRQPKKIQKKIDEILLDIMMLEDGNSSIVLSKIGMEIIGPWGSVPIDDLSDGYRATTQWVLDLLGWQMFAENISEKSSTNNISGIVLIDELEKHLHPTWQRAIISRLKKQLPGIQFIVTSHSPLIAKSVGSIDGNQSCDKIFHLVRGDDMRIQSSELVASLKGLDFDQVLGSEAFDYMVDSDPEVEKILAEASVLAGKTNRDDDEERRLEKVKEILKEILIPDGNTLVEREVYKDNYLAMKKRIEELEKALNIN